MHIGLFDSGVGGLTVLKELQLHLPKTRFSYLGDTARLPYGNKAEETLKKYTKENLEFLDSLAVDVIVIACHSASSVSLDIKETLAGTPVYNVIAPSAQEALSRSPHKKIGVIATKATIQSKVYPKHIGSLDAQAQVISQACPLLVPLVEEGMIDDDITRQVLKKYLTPIIEQRVDTLLLGCTHYPILQDEIATVCGTKIQLINPATTVAQQIKAMNIKAESESALSVYLTDHAPHFLVHAKSLLTNSDNLEILYPR